MGNDDAVDDGTTSSNRTIKAVETSISIIRALKRKETAGIGDLVEETGYSKANVYKHLTTLREQGFVTREDSTYRLGLQYLDLGGLVREQMEGSQWIKSKIAAVADMTGEVAQYMVEDRGASVIIFKEVGHQGVALRTRVGKRLPIHQVASGKAMLANMPNSRIEEIITTHGLPAATENTITTREALYDELASIREQGYAVNQAESTKGLFAVAVPVRTPDETAIGACAVSGPTYRITENGGTERIIDILLNIANEIELNLAYS